MSLRAVLVACLLASGCAAVAPQPKGPPPLAPGEVRSARAAHDMILIGKSSKADVRAALGEATVVDFDSGYSAWVYREQRIREKDKPPLPAVELVILFAPSGI